MTNNDQGNDDRRRFTRIPFRLDAELSRGDERWPTRVLDVSMKGALVERPANWDTMQNDIYTLSIELADAGPTIRLGGRAAHVDETRIGLRCESIDDESLSHLKRLVELNLGDPALLYRELEALLQNASGN